jgi:O-antigen/teichoic acid export membrane protein
MSTSNQIPSNDTSSLFEPLKRLSFQSLIYGIGYVGTRIISFLLLPFYTHLITPTEYGEVTLLFIFIAVANVFYIYGFDIAFLRYYVMENDEVERRKIYGATFFTQVSTSILFTAIILFASQPLVALVFKDPSDIILKARLIRLCAGILFLDCIAVFPFLVLRGRQQAASFTILKLANVLITILLNIWLVAVRKWGIEGIFWANLWTSAVTTLAVTVVTVRYLVPAFSWQMLKKFAVFGFPNIPSLFFVMVIELSDRKILEVLRTTEEVGLYSTWYKMGLFMGIVANAFRFAWQPFFLDHAKRPDAERTFARVLTYFLWITAFLFLALIFFIKPLVQTKLPLMNSSLIAPAFWAGIGVFPVVLLAHILDGVYANFTVGVYIKKKTHFMPFITGIAAALNFGGNLLVVPIWGMYGAAWTTFLSYLVMPVMLYFLIRPHYPIAYEWKRIALITVVTGLLSAIFYIFPNCGWYVRILLLLAFPILLYVTGFFNVGEKNKLNRLWAKLARANIG